MSRLYRPGQTDIHNDEGKTERQMKHTCITMRKQARKKEDKNERKSVVLDTLIKAPCTFKILINTSYHHDV